MNLVEMFGLPFLTCLLLSLVLGNLGLHVLKREVIFIDIAVAQIAALGSLASHIYLSTQEDSLQTLLGGIGATFIAALFFALVRRRADHIPIEAVIGITYAVAAAGTLYIIGKGTGGHTHVQEMLSGALLWVKTGDLLWTTAAFACVSAFFMIFGKYFQKVSEGYDDAVKAGINVTGWDFLFYALTGIVITLSVRLAGVLVTFCFLIIPATFSALFSERWNPRLLIAFLGGAVSSATGLLFSRWSVFSAGISVDIFLGIMLTGGALWNIASGTEQNRRQ